VSHARTVETLREFLIPRTPSSPPLAAMIGILGKTSPL